MVERRHVCRNFTFDNGDRKMKLTSQPKPVSKRGDVIRLRLTARNDGAEERIVSIQFDKTTLAWAVPARSILHLSPKSGYVLPRELPVLASANGPVELEVG